MVKKDMTKMQPDECRCTTKGMKYCKTDVGVRFKGKCPPQPTPEISEGESMHAFLRKLRSSY